MLKYLKQVGIHIYLTPLLLERLHNLIVAKLGLFLHFNKNETLYSFLTAGERDFIFSFISRNNDVSGS